MVNDKACTKPQQQHDMRFTLTEEERESVLLLKAACEEEDVQYKSLFELAKYVLVSKSSVPDSDSKAETKRCRIALERMKKMRAWEKKYGLDRINPLAAMEEAEALSPEYFVNDYVKDRDEGRVVVGHAPSRGNWIHASKEKLAVWFAQEVWRIDLAAADLEEARKGIAIVVRWGTDGFSLKKAVKYIRDFTRCKDVLQSMHNHRIKRIYVQVSPLASKFVNIVKNFLPNKIASRVVVISTIAELDELVERVDGTMTARQWFTERSKVYTETLSKLQI